MGKPCSYVLTEYPEKNGHPCPKPLKAWTRLLEHISQKEHVVLDPFMGAGTTGIACMRTGRRFIGIEINEGYCALAVRSFEAELRQLIMFPAPVSAPAPRQERLL